MLRPRFRALRVWSQWNIIVFATILLCLVETAFPKSEVTNSLSFFMHLALEGISSERTTTSIPFLDVKILLENGKIETDLYCKPTDKHQYLLHSSSHPYHTKKSIPYSLALRLRRICSKDEFFDTRSSELERYLTKRGYKNNFVKSQISRAKSIPKNDTLRWLKRVFNT